MKLFQYIRKICVPSLIIISLFSCKKDKVDNNIVYGTINIAVSVKHHSWPVPNIPVYLKRNTIEFPGTDTSLYELKTFADSDGKAGFEKLHPGKYYLFTSGYDYYFGADVTGSTPIDLTNHTSVNEPVQVILMVSE